MTSEALDLFAVVGGRRGHFVMESGHHSGLWLELDGLFADAQRIDPFVRALATRLLPYRPTVVCGPLLGGAFLAQAVARELAVPFTYTERIAAPPSDDLYRTRYRLPESAAHRVRDGRVAMVDDVVSAGSSLRATHEALTGHGALPVVAGALLVLGSRGSDLLATLQVPLETLARHPYDAWAPAECPRCRAGVPLETVG